MTTQSKRDELAEALTRDPRDGSWVMNPKGAFLKGYDEGFDAAIEEVLKLFPDLSDKKDYVDERTIMIMGACRDRIKSLKEAK